MSQYTIQAGDSLWSIVRNNYEGLSDAQVVEKINKIAAKNGIQNTGCIMAGQTIKLPGIKAENELVEVDLEDEQISDTQTEPEITVEKQKAEPVSKKTPDKKEVAVEADLDVVNKTDKLQKSIKSNQLLKTRIEELQNSIPEPTLDKNGNVKAKIEYFESDKEGPLSGLTIMVNAGHGGQNTVGGPFDCGAVEQNSGYQEWAINKAYSEELIQKILDQGGNVAFVQGTADKVSDAIVRFANKYGNEDNSNLKFLSLHCNITDEANTSASGLDFYYNSTDESSKFSGKLAQAARDNGLSVRSSSPLQLKVCRTAEECGIDGTLIEMGFMNNENDLTSLLNNDKFQNKLLNSVVKGIA